MERTHSMTVGKRAVSVRELTVAEVVGIVEGTADMPEGILWLDHMLTGPIDSALTLFCTDLEQEELKIMYPDEAQAVADKVGEMNPFFVRLLGKIRAKAEELTQSAS